MEKGCEDDTVELVCALLLSRSARVALVIMVGEVLPFAMAHNTHVPPGGREQEYLRATRHLQWAMRAILHQCSTISHIWGYNEEQCWGVTGPSIRSVD